MVLCIFGEEKDRVQRIACKYGFDVIPFARCLMLMDCSYYKVLIPDCPDIETGNYRGFSTALMTTDIAYDLGQHITIDISTLDSYLDKELSLWFSFKGGNGRG